MSDLFSQPQFTQLEREHTLARRLRAHGCGDIFAGTTSRAERLVRARGAIREHALADVLFGKFGGESLLTYAAAFAAVYGEPLSTKRAQA